MKKDTIDKLIGRIDHIKEEDLQRFFVKLAEQQGFFQQVFEAIQEGLILLDNKGKILFVNKAALKLFDKERGQITPDRKSTRLNSSHYQQSRMPSSA